MRGNRVNRTLVKAVVFLFLLTVLLGPLFSIGLGTVASVQSGEGSPIRQVLYILLAAALAVALRPWENYKRSLAIPLPLLVGLGYCWLSLAWAIAPDIAFRRLVLTSMVMWTLFASLRQLRFEEVLALLRLAFAIILVANFVAVAVAPQYGIHSGVEGDEFSLAGDWRGIMQHKNLAGASCAFTVLLFWFDRDRLPRWVQWGVIAAAAYFLYRSNSKTSLGLGLAAIGVGMFHARYRRAFRWTLLTAFSLVAVAITMLEGMYRNPLTDTLSDPKAFTGRTQVWRALIDYIGDHPLLGAGYGSFWHIGPTSPIFTYASGPNAVMPHGHNGFLDLAAQIGIPGLILILVVAVALPLRRLLDSPIVVGERGGLLVALFLFCIGHNFTESSLFDRDLVEWVVLMIAMAMSQPDLILFERARFGAHRLMRFHRPSRAGEGDAAGPAVPAAGA